MSAPLVLILFAVLVAGAGPSLRKASWPDRSPRLGILAWQVLAASVVLSIVLAGLALALPVMPGATSIADFLAACAITLRHQYSTPGGAVFSTAGAAVALLVLSRAGYGIAAELGASARNRGRQLRSLSLMGREDQAGRYFVVDHPAPAAYCLPGGNGTIVFTRAALEALDAEQQEAVLHHERAHLRGRHHLILSVANGLARAFPGVALFTAARNELSRLVELAADDAAAARSGRLTLATALVRLAEAGVTPASTLAAGDREAVLRVRRLAERAHPLRRVRIVLTVAAATAVLALPPAVAAAPAVASAQATMCPVEFAAA